MSLSLLGICILQVGKVEEDLELQFNERFAGEKNNELEKVQIEVS